MSFLIKRQEFSMSRNGLYAVLAILLVAVVGFAIYTYQEKQKPALEVRIDGGGVQINGNGG
ncbi:hypothetical protein [Devosia sp. 2618]|uniref:hypothetical protein n=1 Tax=Devosia sp. 2618 TaxID=3156454 RepID=UPI0033986E7D